MPPLPSAKCLKIYSAVLSSISSNFLLASQKCTGLEAETFFLCFLKFSDLNIHWIPTCFLCLLEFEGPVIYLNAVGKHTAESIQIIPARSLASIKTPGVSFVQVPQDIQASKESESNQKLIPYAFLGFSTVTYTFNATEKLNRIQWNQRKIKALQMPDKFLTVPSP